MRIAPGPGQGGSKEGTLIPDDFRLETDRLALRPFTEADGEAMLRIQGKPEMTRYTPDETWTGMNDARRFLGFAKWLYRDDPIGSLRVLEKAGLRRAGEISGLPGAFEYFNGEPFYEVTRERWEASV